MNKTAQATKHIINYIENRQLKKGDSLPTLREIAATCNVSIFVVKKAIENLKEFGIIDSKWGSGNFVNDSGKSRLNDAIQSLHKANSRHGSYRDSNDYIAFIGKGRNPAFYGGYITGIFDIISQENCLMVLEMSNHSTETEAEIVRKLAENKSIKGIIIGAVNKSQAPNYLQLLEHRNISYVFVGDCDFGETCKATYVKCDNRAGFTETMNHLYEMGHRHIAYVGTPRYDLPANQERYNTYKDFLKEKDLPELYIAGTGGEPREEFISEIRNTQCLKNKITAFACCGDAIAKEVIDSCRMLNLKVPSDISVIGYDSRPWTAYCTPALTSIKYPNEEIGRVAAEELFSMIKDPLNYQNTTIKVKPRIIIRNSVKKI